MRRRDVRALCAAAGVVALLLGRPALIAADPGDNDNDGIPDAQDPDDDDDTVLDVNELVGDTDNDGIVNQFDNEDDGDGVFTSYEYRANAEVQLDTDGDQVLNYLDTDDDGDHILTVDEDPDPNGDHIPKDAAKDSTGSQPNYLNPDDDGDDVLTVVERPNDQDRDTDKDGKPNHLDGDDDGDGFNTDGEVMTRIDLDTDGDGIYDYLDDDDDGDGISTLAECDFVAKYPGVSNVVDVDQDDILNCYDLDSDDDSVADKDEKTGDRDSDKIPDYLDADSLPAAVDADNDVVPNERECPGNKECVDTDKDGKADRDDDDDDGDRVSTRLERGNKSIDTDGDKTPDYLDADDDDDTVSTTGELTATAELLDTDRDGIPNHRDADDNGDGIPTRDQGPPDRDTDGDGVPDYLQIAAAPPLEPEVDAGSVETPVDAGTGSGSGGNTGGGLETEPADIDHGCSLGGDARGGWLIGLLLLALGARTRRRRTTRAHLVALSTFASGCGGSDDPRALPDAAVIDAGFDASVRDAGREAGSSNAIDAGNGCLTEPLDLTIANSTNGRAFAATLSGSRTHLTYLVAGCGAASSSTMARGLRAISFGSTGAASEPTDVINTEATDCAITRDPAIALPSSGAPTVFFSSDATNGYATYQGKLDGMVAYVQIDTATKGVALAGAAALLGDVPTLAYRFSASLGADAAQAAALAISQPGRVQAEVIAASLDHRPAQISLADLGGSGGMRGVVAWLSDRGTTRGLYYRHVDAFGVGNGDVTSLSSNVGAYSAVRVAGRSSGGGALVYSVLGGSNLHVLRFRPLAADGTAGNDVALTGSDQDVAEFAVTAYTDGYAVVYRRRSDGQAGSTSGINLLLVDAHGKLGGSRFIRNVAATQGIEIFTANDGRLILLFTDVPAQSTDTGDLLLRVERLTCL